MSEQAGGRSSGSAAQQADLWRARAADWATIQEVRFRPLYQAVLARPELAGVRSVLDVGCGTGHAAAVFAEAGLHVTGLDACAPFIEMARSRVPGGKFTEGDMEALPYEGGTFDLVTGFNSFQYAASPANALREAARVCGRGGLVVIAVWGPPQDCELAGHLKALGGLLPPPPPGMPGPFALSDPAALRALATSARLEPAALDDADCAFAYDTLDEALRGMLSAGPAERAVRAAGIERAREVVTEAIAPYRTPAGGYRFRNKFRFLVARA